MAVPALIILTGLDTKRMNTIQEGSKHLVKGKNHLQCFEAYSEFVPGVRLSDNTASNIRTESSSRKKTLLDYILFAFFELLKMSTDKSHLTDIHNLSPQHGAYVYLCP